ncbi:MAG TPA: hypothetical protein VF546_02150 [Pyrinomonadaceae bacterium]|jgi:KDO2-lipid IV(A) lauroyltransferase
MRPEIISKALAPSPLAHRLMQLTAPLCTAAAHKLADAYGALNDAKNAQLRDNFALAFPHLGEPELAALVKRHRRSTFHSELERRQLDVMPRAHLRDYLQTRIEIEGGEHLRAACESPDPVVLFTPHYGSFAVGVMRTIMEVDRFRPISLFYESPETNPTTYMYKGLMERLGCNSHVLYNDRTAVLKGLRALKQGHVLGIMPDVFEYNMSLMYVPFFGRLTVAMGGTAFFALKAKARLIPGYCWRRGRGRFTLKYGAPIELSRTGDMDEDIFRTTARIFANIQEQLTAAPEHWVYWDTLCDRMGYGAEVELPRERGAWRAQFARLRGELATGGSNLGRYLRAFEAQLTGDESSKA